MLSEPEAHLLLKDNPDLVLAVYDYWLSKRLRAVKHIVCIIVMFTSVTTNTEVLAYLSCLCVLYRVTQTVDVSNLLIVIIVVMNKLCKCSGLLVVSSGCLQMLVILCCGSSC